MIHQVTVERRKSPLLFILVVSLLAMLVMVLTSCSGLQVNEDYVRADRATYNLVSPIIRSLADDDPTNNPDLKGINGKATILAIDSWAERLTRGEALLK